MKTRIHITVEGTTMHFLSTQQKELGEVPLGKVVDTLVRQCLDRSEEEKLADMVAQKVVEKLNAEH